MLLLLWLCVESVAVLMDASLVILLRKCRLVVVILLTVAGVVVPADAVAVIPVNMLLQFLYL
jgi:hypothetical protein